MSFDNDNISIDSDTLMAIPVTSEMPNRHPLRRLARATPPHHVPPAPVEIALQILDHADYMLALTVRMVKQTEVCADNPKTDYAATVLLVTDPVPKGAKVKSDGGGEGATAPILCLSEQLRSNSVDLTDPETSFPAEGWREVTVAVGNYDISRWMVQRSARTGRKTREHVVEWRKGRAGQTGVLTGILGWHDDGKGLGEGFLEAPREGDMVILIGSARYPAWVNHMWGAEIEVRFSA
ncbi:hypothetical protein BDZ91DRAFT_797259 [Kalaharituber pfeilii]|nr:hypothetical protein BDZ91DRAFT_797259 [Kalaharituber pfeilii]